MFMFKLVLGDKNKIVKLKTDSFQLLKKQIEKSFNHLPIDYCLSYLDEDKDQICLNSDEDMSVLLGIGAKVNKVFIKQSLSQVIQIENTFQIEPTFQVNQSIDEIKDNYVNPNECHKIQIAEYSVNTLELNNKDEKQQVKEQVKLEINIEKQDEPDETEINKGVFKNVFFTKNEEVVDEINVQQKINNQKNDPPAKEQKKELIIQPQINIPQEVTKIQIKQEEIINSAENNQEINKTEIKEDNKINDEKNQQKKNEQVVINLNVQEKKQQIKQQPIVDIIIPVEQKKIQIQKQLPLKKQIIKNDKIQKDMFKIGEQKPINIQLHYHKVVCSECQDDYGIIGIRYQCILCENYNICQRCEESNAHVHSLVKVKIPSKDIKKEDIIKKYRKQIYGPIEPHYNIPQGNYVPSISKQQALGYIKAAQQTFNEVLQRNKRIMNAMYFKLEMNHKNPYEILKQQKSVIKPNPQTIKDKITYLVNLLAIQQRQASYFCNMYKDVSKERIAEIYLEKMEKR